MAHLRATAPENLKEIVDYFDTYYVHGGFRSVRTPAGTLKMRRLDPRFEISKWNVHNATRVGTARTNIICESWNNSFRNLVGHQDPALWPVISCFEKDATMVETEILRVQRGEPTVVPVRKTTVTYQRTLKTLCDQRSRGEKNIEQFLDAIGRLIWLC